MTPTCTLRYPRCSPSFPFLAPDDWSLPTGEFPGETTPEGYRARLTELAAQHNDPTVPFITWGYHPLWHGEIWREDLNEMVRRTTRHALAPLLP